jgi:signal transduction histidine kinase
MTPNRLEDVVPAVSEQLKQISGTLATLAGTLSGFAHMLKQSHDQACDAATPHDDLSMPGAASIGARECCGSAATHPSTARGEFDANDFLAIVSHELMVPLAAVTGMAARIKESAAGGALDASVQACAEDILRSAASMEHLIQDLRGGSVDAEQPEPAPGCQDVADLIDHAVETFQALAASASITLTREVSGPIMARYDSPRLFEALAHLIENAITFTPAGAFIRICASCQGEECVVCVADGGIGIPEHELLSIFDPFQERSSGDHRSRGVGLYLARSIIEAHGGRMWAESEVGVGSAFYFTLPLA